MEAIGIDGNGEGKLIEINFPDGTKIQCESLVGVAMGLKEEKEKTAVFMVGLWSLNKKLLAKMKLENLFRDSLGDV